MSEGSEVSLTLRHGHRPFWIGVGFALGFMALVQGANYVATGNSRVTSPNYYVLVHDLPGGMRTHGYILLSIAALMLYNLKSDTRWRKYTVMVFCFECIAITFAQLGAWWIDHADKFNWAGPATWLSFAIISGLMIVHPPPPKGSDDV